MRANPDSRMQLTRRCVAAALLALAAGAYAGTDPLPLVTTRLAVGGTERQASIPQGSILEVLTEDLAGPRLATFHANGDLFIGSRSGKVYRLAPPYRTPEVLITLSGYPHSVAFRGEEILIARTEGLYAAPYRAGQGSITPASVRLLAKLPGGGGHDSRTVSVGPDGRVYLALGIAGNCSDQYLGEGYGFGDRRGGILVLGEDGRWEPYGSGLRNPVGMDWQPGTGELYATNNGPDHWGYDQPPEVFVRVPAGSFHGMPWFQLDGTAYRRDSCIAGDPPRPITDLTLPAATFPARSAPLGMAFAPLGSGVLAGDAILALHGSWGTKPSGRAFGDPASRRPPKVVAVRFAGGKAVRVDDLVTGFQLPDGQRWARPAGVAVGPDGAVYFTSDAGSQALFRLRPLAAGR